MKASESYSPFMDMMTEKITMSKIAIELSMKSPDATYEDLINKIQVDISQSVIISFYLALIFIELKMKFCFYSCGV